MRTRITYAIPGLMLMAEQSMAQAVALPGAPPSLSVASLPLDMGGLAAVATVSLIIGAQLIRRKK